MFDTAIKKGPAEAQSGPPRARPPQGSTGQHAFRMAVSAAPPMVQRKCTCAAGGGPCPECEEKE